MTRGGPGLVVVACQPAVFVWPRFSLWGAQLFRLTPSFLAVSSLLSRLCLERPPRPRSQSCSTLSECRRQRCWAHWSDFLRQCCIRSEVLRRLSAFSSRTLVACVVLWFSKLYGYTLFADCPIDLICGQASYQTIPSDSCVLSLNCIASLDIIWHFLART